MNKVLRWGSFYLLLLLIWAGVGAFNQNQRLMLASLSEEKTALEQRYNLLMVNQLQQTSPHRLYRWGRQQGYVPLSQGNWQREVGKP